jgi:hypothetical protein
MFTAMKLYEELKVFLHHKRKRKPNASGIQEYQCTGMSGVVHYEYLLGMYFCCICL